MTLFTWRPSTKEEIPSKTFNRKTDQTEYEDDFLLANCINSCLWNNMKSQNLGQYLQIWGRITLGGGSVIFAFWICLIEDESGSFSPDKYACKLIRLWIWEFLSPDLTSPFLLHLTAKDSSSKFSSSAFSSGFSACFGVDSKNVAYIRTKLKSTKSWAHLFRKINWWLFNENVE